MLPSVARVVASLTGSAGRSQPLMVLIAACSPALSLQRGRVCKIAAPPQDVAVVFCHVTDVYHHVLLFPFWSMKTMQGTGPSARPSLLKSPAMTSGVPSPSQSYFGTVLQEPAGAATSD